METTQFTISTIVFIVSLIVPGVIIKRVYYQGQFTKQFGSGAFADRLIMSLFLGLIVQMLSFLIFSKYWGFTYTSIKTQIASVYASIGENKIPELKDDHQLAYILGYLLFTVFIAIAMGHLAHNFIRIFKLDVRYNILRFANKWNYLIRGDILKSREFKGNKTGKVYSTMVDIVYEDSTDKTKMVKGLLTDYTISEKTGELESIHLTGAQRLSNTSQTYKPIPGDCFIIPCDRMVDMNLIYIINVQDNNKKRIYIFRTISVIGVFGLIACLIYPWYLDIRVLNKILGIIFSMTSLSFFIIFISAPFQTEAKSRLPLEAKIICIIGALVFLYLTLLLIHQLPTI